MPRLVDDENLWERLLMARRAAPRALPALAAPSPKPETPERKVLKVAKNQGRSLIVALASY